MTFRTRFRVLPTMLQVLVWGQLAMPGALLVSEPLRHALVAPASLAGTLTVGGLLVLPPLVALSILFRSILFLPFILLECALLLVGSQLGTLAAGEAKVLHGALSVCMTVLALLAANRDILSPFMTRNVRAWRRSDRLAINARIKVQLGDAALDAVIEDISLSGISLALAASALIRAGESLSKGANCRVAYALGAGASSASVTVAWIHTGELTRVGLRADSPDEMAMLIKALDISYQPNRWRLRLARAWTINAYRRAAVAAWAMIMAGAAAVPACGVDESYLDGRSNRDHPDTAGDAGLRAGFEPAAIADAPPPSIERGWLRFKVTVMHKPAFLDLTYSELAARFPTGPAQALARAWPPHRSVLLTTRYESVTSPGVGYVYTRCAVNHGTECNDPVMEVARDYPFRSRLVEARGRIETIENRVREGFSLCECDPQQPDIQPQSLLSLMLFEQESTIYHQALQRAIDSSLDCVPGIAAAVAIAWGEGNIAGPGGVIELLANGCQNINGDWQNFMMVVEAEMRQTVGNYHVCNNDAAVRVAFFQSIPLQTGFEQGRTSDTEKFRPECQAALVGRCRPPIFLPLE